MTRSVVIVAGGSKVMSVVTKVSTGTLETLVTMVTITTSTVTLFSVQSKHSSLPVITSSCAFHVG
jgi:hypothetical protein